MGFGWEGQKLRLIPLEREKHFENCVRWMNDPDITQWTLMGDFPLTRLAEQEFFDRVAKENETNIIFALETFEEEHIGVTGIHQVSFRHGTGVTGTIIGRKPLWGRGYGTDAIAVRTRYAFQVLGLRLLMSEVMAENTASYRALLKNGYHETGRIPKRYWKRGAYRDVIQLMIAREDWKP
jgi:RimJ/RimL family protein N-acetyltransferase